MLSGLVIKFGDVVIVMNGKIIQVFFFFFLNILNKSISWFLNIYICLKLKCNCYDFIIFIFIYIQVDNIDVEGRFILVDVLCYSEQFNFFFILDMVILIGNYRFLLDMKYFFYRNGKKCKYS